MADEFDENDFEEDFQEADEPDEPEDLDAAEGDQEQIDILPAGKYFSNFSSMFPHPNIFFPI